MAIIVNGEARAVLEVSMFVEDLERSRHFYEEILGFSPYGTLTSEHGTIYGLLFDSALIKLMTEPKPGHRVERDGTFGLRHITLRVKNAAAVVADCERAGYTVEVPPSPLPAKGDGPAIGQYAIVRDPDGNRVELSEGTEWAGAPAG